MPENQMVPVFWLRHLVEYLGARTPLVVSTLEELGLRSGDLENSDLKVEQATEAEFLSIMSCRRNDPFLGAHAGLCLDIRQTTLLSYLIFNAQTLDHALQNLVRFLPLMRPAANVKLTKSDDRVLVTFHNQNRAIAMNVQYIEFSVAMLINALRQASEHAVSPLSVAFAHARTDDADILGTLFSCPVVFHEGITTIALHPSILTRPVVRRDANLYREMLGYGHLLLSKNEALPRTLEEQVAEFIVQHLTRSPPSIDEAAEALGLSVRTLGRRLAQCGTSYRVLRDTLRISAAQEMLRNTDTALAEITYLLGYSDQSAFGAAFKRATGDTPHHYRVQHHKTVV